MCQASLFIEHVAHSSDVTISDEYALPWMDEKASDVDFAQPEFDFDDYATEVRTASYL